MDDKQKKILIGVLAALLLGAGSWYFVFSGGESAEERFVKKDRGPKRDRRAGATTTKKKKRKRARADAKPEAREKRTREYDEVRKRPKKSRSKGSRKKKKKKNTTPMAFAPLDFEPQEAIAAGECTGFLPALPFAELDSYLIGKTA